GAHTARSAVRFDEPLDRGETETDPGSARVGPADVGLEVPHSERRRDSRPRVLDLEQDAAAPLADAEGYFAQLRVAQVLEAVAEEVAEHAEEDAGAAGDGALGNVLAPERGVALRG